MANSKIKRSKTGREAAGSAKRRELAVELRMQGYTMRELGKALGVSHAQAHRDLVQALGELAERTCDEAAKLRAIESERLHKMILYSWPSAEQGDPRAIANITRLSESLRKLWGADAEEKGVAAILVSFEACERGL
jgi:hypothetical protein